MSDYILFDLDGTLTDPKVGITSCVQYALDYFGIQEPDADKLTPFIGPPLKQSFMDFYDFDEEKAEEAVEKYRERFKEIGVLENRIYDGVPEMIKKLKGNHKKLAVASSKPTVFVEEILERFEIRKYIDVVVGSELDGTRTNKAEVVQEALRRLYGEEAEDLEQKKKNTVMIGDRKFDVEGAKANGIASVAVSYGYGLMDELRIANPDIVIRSVEELEKYLLRGTKKTVKEPPMAKIWFVIFPALIYFFVREMGFYVGSFIVINLANILPKNLAEQLLTWDETGKILTGVTGNGSALMAGIAFLIVGIVIWKFYAKADIMEAKNKLVSENKYSIKEPLSYVGMVIGTLGLAVGLNLLFDLVGITNKSEVFQQAAQQQYAAVLPLGLLVNGLIAPISEELIFRGIVYNRFRKHMKYLPSIVFSALCFGLYHQNIVQGSYAFLMGCVIAWLYEKFGNFYIPVIAHIISNVTAYMLTATGLFSILQANWPICIFFLVLGAAGVFVVYKTIGKPLPQDIEVV